MHRYASTGIGGGGVGVGGVGGGGGGSSRRGSALCSPRRGAAAFVLTLLALYGVCCVSLPGASAGASAGAGGGAAAPPPWSLLSALRGRGAPPAPAPLSAAEEAAAEAAAKAAVRAELGRGAWTLLHRLAAQYPSPADEAAQARAEALLYALGDLYPCPECAEHFRGVLAASPPRAHLADNRALSLWLCAAHNEVNARLGKPRFECSLEALKERWGSCGCFDVKNGTEAAAAEAAAAPPALVAP
jgi:FAD-linked sulfhydryl oxidase